MPNSILKWITWCSFKLYIVYTYIIYSYSTIFNIRSIKKHSQSSSFPLLFTLKLKFSMKSFCKSYSFTPAATWPPHATGTCCCLRRRCCISICICSSCGSRSDLHIFDLTARQMIADLSLSYSLFVCCESGAGLETQDTFCCLVSFCFFFSLAPPATPPPSRGLFVSVLSSLLL